MSQRTNFRRQLRITIADFSQGRLPSYTIDTFPTPEGTLGIKLKPEVQLGFGKDAVKTKTSVNIYWFCKHLEYAGWIVKECFIGEEPDKNTIEKHVEKINDGVDWVIRYKPNIKIYDGNCTIVYIIVRKIDESDIDGNIQPKKNNRPNHRS